MEIYRSTAYRKENEYKSIVVVKGYNEYKSKEKFNRQEKGSEKRRTLNNALTLSFIV